MTMQTMLTTLGAAILLVVIAIAMYMLGRPGIPNTGVPGAETPISTTSDVLINTNANANLNDDGSMHDIGDDHGGLIEEAGDDHSE